MDAVITEESSAAGQSELVLIGEDIRPVRVSILYQLGLVVVAGAMVLLPLIYVGLVGLFGYGVYYHATENVSILSWQMTGRAAVVKFLVYIAPLVVGAILMLFLVKPLFARRVETSDPVSIDHSDAPLLFALIGRICQTVGAPIPSRVDVDCEVNASASFRSGFGSLFGNDVKLTIGLPLVAGLNLREFAGVLAHEFGHFAQGTAMRLSYVVRSINHWFARVVYERDSWDVWLTEASENSDWRIAIILWLARGGVAISRGVLWILMMIGNLVSSFMLRQMEYDADQYEVRLAGSAAFIATARHLQHLNASAGSVWKQLQTMWKKEHCLYDNVPELVVHLSRHVPADLQSRLHSEALQRKTGFLDTHPCDADRIQRAEMANEPGVYQRAEPASVLFTDFAGISRRVTLDTYYRLTGAEVSEKELVATAQTSKQETYDASADMQTVKEYFLGLATSLRPVAIPEARSLSLRGADDLKNDLRTAREQMNALVAEAEPVHGRFKEADASLMQAVQAEQLALAGLESAAAELQLDLVQPGSAIADAERELDEARKRLEPFESAARARIAAAVQLLRSPQMLSLIRNALSLRDELQDMLSPLAQVVATFDVALRLRLNLARLEILMSARTEQSGAVGVVEEVAKGIEADITAIQERLASLRNPFSDGSETFVGQYLKNKEYDPDPCQQLLLDARSHVERLILLYYRLLARIISILRQVEAAVE
jgi:Zn-dependent protease with chaperone function